MTKVKNNRKAKTPKNSIFESTINNFTNNIDCLLFSIPIIMGLLRKEYEIARREFDNFLAKKFVKRGRGRVIIKFEDAKQYEALRKKVRNSHSALHMVPRSLLISLMSFFDSYLKELLEIVFNKNQNLLNSTEKKISVSEILDIKSFEETKTYLINREIEQLLYEGRSKCLEWLENKLNIKFNLEASLKKEFIEICERRNLLVHSSGAVTKQYLSICRRNGVHLDKKLNVGDVLPLPPAYFYRSCFVVLTLGVAIGQVLWRKLNPDKLEDADRSLVNMTAELISDGNNLAAGMLLDFANKIGKYSSDELKLMLVINQALAMKFGNAQAEAIKLVNSHDWSVTEKKFKLAVAIIKSDLHEAKKIMLDIGPANEMKIAYKDWPLFKEFRKTPAFRKTYKKIFNEAFFIRDKKMENNNIVG